MSDKLECPGCGSYSSTVLAKAEQGEPCPFCGLSATAIREINQVRRIKADKDLKQRLETALIERDRAMTELVSLRRTVSEVRLTVGCRHDDEPSPAAGFWERHNHSEVVPCVKGMCPGYDQP